MDENILTTRKGATPADIHTELEERLMAAKGLSDLLWFSADSLVSRKVLDLSAGALSKLMGDIDQLFHELPMPRDEAPLKSVGGGSR